MPRRRVEEGTILILLPLLPMTSLYYDLRRPRRYYLLGSIAPLGNYSYSRQTGRTDQGQKSSGPSSSAQLSAVDRVDLFFPHYQLRRDTSTSFIIATLQCLPAHELGASVNHVPPLKQTSRILSSDHEIIHTTIPPSIFFTFLFFGGWWKQLPFNSSLCALPFPLRPPSHRVFPDRPQPARRLCGSK